MIDAPVASGSGAGSGSDDEEEGEEDSDVDEEEEEDDDEDGVEEQTSDSGEEEEDEDEGEGSDIDDDVDIIMPEDQYDLTKEKVEPQTKIKPSAWHDPSDGTIGIDLAEVRRLKKLARGKPNSKVGGAELEKRLREQ